MAGLLGADDKGSAPSGSYGPGRSGRDLSSKGRVGCPSSFQCAGWIKRSLGAIGDLVIMAFGEWICNMLLIPFAMAAPGLPTLPLW